MDCSSTYFTSIPKNAWMDEEASEDFKRIDNNKDSIIAGYLGIGENDIKGLKEGGRPILGMSFARYMFRKFWHENSAAFSEYRDIFERAIKAFSMSAQRKGQQEETQKTMLDSTSLGWQKHLVVRMVGHFGNVPDMSLPFFEVMINSALNYGSDKCYPFDAHIMENGKIALERAEKLKGLNTLPENIGFDVTYFDVLPKPEQFIESYKRQHQKSPGPNSMRLLNGLKTLNVMEMKGQTIGNCWIKQPKRAVFVALFIETLTQRNELNPKKALALSKILYKKWTAFNRKEIKSMLGQGGITLELHQKAIEKLCFKKK